MREYDDDGEIKKDFPPTTKWYILVTHDESTFHANDSSSYTWKKKGLEWLRPKSRGKGLMVSDFLTAAIGRLRLHDQNTQHEEYACEIIQYGSGHSDDGWWDSECMIKQVRDKAIPIFEKAFPGDTALFLFDNSSGHACKAPDALVANRMNMKPKGKQPKMRATVMGVPAYGHVVAGHVAKGLWLPKRYAVSRD